ncbi:hypothetical protein llap_10578 [Limosa lapponica baueri]|uniref:Uncharacterized protein n=1 Tax=Limosa lapponica baueri TaxID=1758121 RepID=A0A2I0TZA6_LIMLA|nr:hypothetical protein llap_10578 [Limosa lapponica baueri]
MSHRGSDHVCAPDNPLLIVRPPAPTAHGQTEQQTLKSPRADGSGEWWGKKWYYSDWVPATPSTALGIAGEGARTTASLWIHTWTEERDLSRTLKPCPPSEGITASTARSLYHLDALDTQHPTTTWAGMSAACLSQGNARLIDVIHVKSCLPLAEENEVPTFCIQTVSGQDELMSDLYCQYNTDWLSRPSSLGLSSERKCFCPDHTGGPPLNFLQFIDVLLALEHPKMDTIFWLLSIEC